MANSLTRAAASAVFRKNSIYAKIITHFSRLVAKNWLAAVVAAEVKAVIAAGSSYEVSTLSDKNDSCECRWIQRL
jgi:hypothetical protein